MLTLSVTYELPSQRFKTFSILLNSGPRSADRWLPRDNVTFSIVGFNGPEIVNVPRHVIVILRYWLLFRARTILKNLATPWSSTPKVCVGQRSFAKVGCVEPRAAGYCNRRQNASRYLNCILVGAAVGDEQYFCGDKVTGVFLSFQGS